MSLTLRQKQGLYKLGDILCPATLGLPQFSQTPVVERWVVLENGLYPEDKKDVLMLLTILSYCPRWMIWLLIRCSNCDALRSRIYLLRLLEIGMKGLVYSLYYSYPPVLKVIGWNAHVNTCDTKGSEHL